MARYGKAFKGRAVARLLPPESAAVEVVSREIGVSASTLERWRADALALGERGGLWTAAARFDAVLITTAMSEAETSAWCRSQGVHVSELVQWRDAARAALDAPADALPGSVAERRRVKELERELRRKEKALAEAAALLVLSKKLEALYPKDADA